MEPANFPQRINRRREMALNALALRHAGQKWPEKALAERATLLDRIVFDARGVRTKKDRSSRASLRRA